MRTWVPKRLLQSILRWRPRRSDGAEAPAAAEPPVLTEDQAVQIMDLVTTRLEDPDVIDKVVTDLQEASEEKDPSKYAQFMTTQLLPLILGDVNKEMAQYGFDESNAMAGVQ